MTTVSTHYAAALSGPNIALLRDIARGIEKEGLRVQAASGMLAQTKHPEALGAALTHSSITTDYSESLLEFITPVKTSIEESLSALQLLHRYTASKLSDELIWGASMPCIVAGERSIPIAQYGSSNVGTMKRVYRNGLGVRYGRMMQAIAGIHYNFSMPDAFWQHAWENAGSPGTLQDFKTDGYLGLIRNFFNRVWLLVYLMGASPAVCASFLAGRKDHPLEPFDANAHSYYLPYATSLRMGDLGYNSDAQAGLHICYNSLDNYIRTLHKAIVEPHPDYAQFVTTPEGELAQLSDSLLQIENEFYSPIRPKRVTHSGEAPLVALDRAGIEYIEVRCVDIDPFLPLGIDEHKIRLLDAFLLSCLLDNSPICTEDRRQREAENLRRVVNQGRNPSCQLLTEEGEQPFSVVAGALLDRVRAAAQQLDTAHQTTLYTHAVDSADELIKDPELTPSAQVLREMQNKGGAYWRVALEHSKEWHLSFLEAGVADSARLEMEALAAESLAKQREIEAGDDVDFATYLRAFYAQYQGLVS